MSGVDRTAYDADVAILGSGLGGGLLAAMLAAAGVEVVVFERGSHPRFAVGESTVPETTAMLGILAARYGVPEIAQLADFQSVRRHVSSACGVKRSFSFVHHQEGREQVPEHCTQFLTWAPPFGPDVHYFRQDVDAWAVALAVAYGARVRQQTAVTELAIEPDAVSLSTDRGHPVRARFVVDGTGYRSLVARARGLRDEPTRLATRSRALFTHMVGVRPYDDCGPPRRRHGLPSPLHQGTLHHIFDGGWLWVIPFDNHPGSTNPLTSVGFCLDADRFPQPSDETPEEEFRRLVGRLPSVERQMADARAVREWVSTPRLQYSSREVVGDRFCLLPHAAGFVDALFSSGLALTVQCLNLLTGRLVEAVREDDFRRERFLAVETAFERSLGYYDRLVAGSFVAFRDFDLWNAWYRVWLVGSLYGVSGQHEIFARYRESGDPRELERFETPPYRATQASDLPEYAELFDAAHAWIERVARGEATNAEATAAIYRLLEESPLSPAPWRLTDPGRRFPGTFTLLPLVQLLAWGRYRSPEVVRRHYFRSGKPLGLVAALVATQAAELGRSGRLGLGLLRDSFFSWNREWRRRPPGRTTWHS